MLYAKGEYIGFVDSDDYVDSSFLEKMYNKSTETQSQIVVCGYYAIDEFNDTYKWLQKGNMNVLDISVKDCKMLIHKNAPYAWNKLFRRTLFERFDIKFPQGLLYEDISTCYPLLVCANKVSKVNKTLIYYTLKRKESITGSFSRKMLQMLDSLKLFNQRFKHLYLFDQ